MQEYNTKDVGTQVLEKIKAKVLPEVMQDFKYLTGSHHSQISKVRCPVLTGSRSEDKIFIKL